MHFKPIVHFSLFPLSCHWVLIERKVCPNTRLEHRQPCLQYTTFYIVRVCRGVEHYCIKLRIKFYFTQKEAVTFTVRLPILPDRLNTRESNIYLWHDKQIFFNWKCGKYFFLLFCQAYIVKYYLYIFNRHKYQCQTPQNKTHIYLILDCFVRQDRFSYTFTKVSIFNLRKYYRQIFTHLWEFKCTVFE